MRELSDAGCDRLAVDNGLPYATGIERELIRAGYAAGYRAAQAACAPRELAYQCPNYGAMPPSLDHQPAATSVSDGATAAPSEATASVTDQAADPLPVAWATPSLLVTMSAVEKRRLTSPEMRGRGGEWEADARDADRYSVPLYRAAALERLRAERDEWYKTATKLETEARKLDHERDTLRAIVRAADAMRLHSLILLGMPGGYADYDRARAKVVIP